VTARAVTARAARWSVLDLVEGFQLAHAVAALHDLGVLASLARPATAAALARTHGLDAQMLGGVLAYLAARTDLVARRGARFVATAQYTPAARYVIDLYAGAYGRNAARLAALLRAPGRAGAAVDRRRHARAFAAVADAGRGALPGLVRQLGQGAVLDLGCGTGALLLALAAEDPRLAGWGLEHNPAMRRTARGAVRAAGLARRIRILAGDVTALAGAIPDDVAAAVRTVTMCDVANELFRDGPAGFAAWLRTARARLPGRLLIVSDYYGRLDQSGARLHRETLLQDYVQVISGQGVPPADVRAWQAIYRRAGCRLLHAIEDRTTTRFLHIARLAPGAKMTG
jgi:SAM-dependent methyltransferase